MFVRKAGEYRFLLPEITLAVLCRNAIGGRTTENFYVRIIISTIRFSSRRRITDSATFLITRVVRVRFQQIDQHLRETPLEGIVI